MQGICRINWPPGQKSGCCSQRSWSGSTVLPLWCLCFLQKPRCDSKKKTHHVAWDGIRAKSKSTDCKSTESMKLGQWVTSPEAHSISLRPISRGRKLGSSVQHDFSSFRSWLSMTWWSLILKNISAQWFGIAVQRNIHNNNRQTGIFAGQSSSPYKPCVLDHTYLVSSVGGRPPHSHGMECL